MKPFRSKRIVISFLLIVSVLTGARLTLRQLLNSEHSHDSPHQSIPLQQKSVQAETQHGSPPASELQDGVRPRTGVRRVNRGIAHYNAEFYDRLRALTSRKAEARDPELVALVRDVIDEPSDLKSLKMAKYVMRTPQINEVEAIFNHTRDKFYVECGALDGERSSNTLFLEKERGWSGLLLEMDPHFYTQLLGKSRKAWSVNACLSPYDYVTELPFRGDVSGRGRIDLQSKRAADVITVPCFPFETFMLALGRAHVDYFSLDVEGVELNVLKTIPFDRVSVDVMSVEYGHAKGGKEATRDFMERQGFRMHKDIHFSNPSLALYVEDFIFVHKSVAHETLTAS